MSTATDAYKQRFDSLRGNLDGPELFTPLRDQGLKAFTSAGLPTGKVEAWKFTSLRALEREPILPGETADSMTPASDGLVEGAARAIVANGRFQDDASALTGLPEGVVVCGLADAAQRHEALVKPHLGSLASDALPDLPLAGLNAAFMQDGLFFYVPKNTKVEPLIEVLFTSHSAGSQAFSPRNLIILEDGAECSLLEHWIGDGRYFNNSVTEVILGQNAHFGHFRYQQESKEAYHISSILPVVPRDASYDNFTLTTGAKLARNEVHVDLTGEGAVSHLNGVYLIDGDQHTDTTTHTDHLKPHGNSNQTYKGVIDGKAHAVFQGKIHVHKGAQKTDGYQLNNALLLSPDAEVNAKPELEIYADDVKCSHGATSGQIDRNALFYLRARGIPEKEAMALLIESFIGEAIELIDHEPVQEKFLGIARDWLRRR